MLQRKLRMGMIGGGPGAFIGAIHRKAAQLDGNTDIVCGAFSSDPERSIQKGKELLLNNERVYGSYKEMIRREASLSTSEKMDFVSIVTPNHLHFEPAMLALENGFDVVLDKPMTISVKQAIELSAMVRKSGKYFCLTHTYTGYPMIKEARHQIQHGRLGTIRKIWIEYPQGWLNTSIETSGNKQAAWRTDPERSGSSGSIADIGVHAFNLAEYVSGLKVTEVCADLKTFVKGRKLDDDGSVLLHFNNGATGVLIASQVAAGEENNLRIRIYGENGGLDWQHNDPNSLIFKSPAKPVEVWKAGEAYLSDIAKYNCRTPSGHPEGYLEAFANLYRNFGLCVNARIAGIDPKPEWLDFPGAEDGLRGMLFIEKTIESGKSNSKWIKLEA